MTNLICSVLWQSMQYSRATKHAGDHMLWLQVSRNPELQLWRAVALDLEVDYKNKHNETVVFWGFTSTTRSMDALDAFAPNDAPQVQTACQCLCHSKVIHGVPLLGTYVHSLEILLGWWREPEMLLIIVEGYWVHDQSGAEWCSGGGTCGTREEGNRGKILSSKSLWPQRTLFSIKVKAAADLQPYSSFAPEKELLLFPATVFKVHNVKRISRQALPHYNFNCISGRILFSCSIPIVVRDITYTQIYT